MEADLGTLALGQVFTLGGGRGRGCSGPVNWLHTGMKDPHVLAPHEYEGSL